MKSLICILLCLATLLSGFLNSPLAYASQNYRRQEIADARFGTAEKEAFIFRARQVSENINRRIFGQQIASTILEEKLVQFGESFPNRKGEPIHLNLIGLPGIGKTGMLKVLQDLGFNVIILNAQDFTSEKSDFSSAVANQMANHDLQVPTILVVDELDKVPEIIEGEPEKTNSLTGTLNAMLSEGAFFSESHGHSLDVSNVMIITTMNFSPREMKIFTSEVLKTEKSFFDFTVDDFLKFDDWIKNQDSARYKVLANLFRTNTVSRLAPNTVMMQPLTMAVYRQVVEVSVQKAIQISTESVNGLSQRMEVTYDQSLIDYLTGLTVFAPSGARETITKAKALTEQLISYGKKTSPETGDSYVDRPRKIHINVKNGRPFITVIPQVFQRTQTLADKPGFTFEVNFDKGSRLFLPPTNLVRLKPEIKVRAKGAAQMGERPITKTETFQARFPKMAKLPDGIADKINNEIFGQQGAVTTILDDMVRFMGRLGPAIKEPSMRVLSGFPGIGKSEVVKLLAKLLGIPLVKINLQQFSSDSPEALKQFYMSINSQVASLGNQKYILLLEEFDKIFELDPMGALVNRPVIAAIKDLLNEGVSTLSVDEYNTKTIDIRNAFTFITMNFSVDRFGFQADPRQTTIEDVIKAWKMLNSSPAALKSLLGSMFLPETVSRLLARFSMMKPLTHKDYERVIAKQTQKLIEGRLLDNRNRNVGKIEMALSKNYRDYLFNETVIPSEGARHTVVSAQNKISSDLEFALSKIPRRGRFATAPLVLTLDFAPGKSEVVIYAQVVGDVKNPPQEIARRPIALQFPSTRVRGRVLPERMFTAMHEFGHAYTALRLGLRIREIVSVPPRPGIGGHVQFEDTGQRARDLVSHVYSALASRAFERIFSSENPLDPQSVLDITAGPSMDIKQASMNLYNVIYELGMDPNGGTVDRNFVLGPGKYADYASLPPELAVKLGHILRSLEQYMVEDFLKLHPQDWYVTRINKVAREGMMNERQFIELVGMQNPGLIKDSEGHYVPTVFRNIFSKYIKSEPESSVRARTRKAEGLGLSVEETVAKYMDNFAQTIDGILHISEKRGLKKRSASHKNCGDLLDKR